MIKTRVTEMLGIEYPIVQAPMGGGATMVGETRAALGECLSSAG